MFDLIWNTHGPATCILKSHVPVFNLPTFSNFPEHHPIQGTVPVFKTSVRHIGAGRQHPMVNRMQTKAPISVFQTQVITIPSAMPIRTLPAQVGIIVGQTTLTKDTNTGTRILPMMTSFTGKPMSNGKQSLVIHYPSDSKPLTSPTEPISTSRTSRSKAL